MSYQVLARKWRPKNFDQVLGQEHVLRALSNALLQKRLHHAYLFTGTRGVGKTTIARILAKCLNCESDITRTPCGSCDVCVDIDAGRFIDLIEVDAASRTKVEDTRDLLDNVQYLPTKGRYKIYIIDEVHMLSGHSFNALLKTLEEPPAHVKFLLATTDPQKLPVTVLSRCLQFNLRSLSSELIKNQLAYILGQEKISFEDEALWQLARSASGSVRDSLSLLDQAIAYGHNRVIAEDVRAMLGVGDGKKIIELFEALIADDANMMLELIDQMASLNTNFMDVLDKVLETLHDLAVFQMTGKINADDRKDPEILENLASRFNPEDIQLYYQIGLIGKRDMMLAPSLKSGFSMVMLRMLAFRLGTVNSDVKVAKPVVKTTDVTSGKKADKTDEVLKPTTESHPKLDCINMVSVIEKLDITGPTQALLSHCVVAKVADNMLELWLDPSQAPMLNKKHEERIAAALSKHYGYPILVTIKLGEPNMETRANLKKIEDNDRKEQTLESLQKNHKMQELMSRFDAKVVSIT